MSLQGPICDMAGCPLHVCFSNRPFWVKHFQAIHQWVLMSLAGSRFSSESALPRFTTVTTASPDTIRYERSRDRLPPISSTMQTLVSLTDTSNPAKWSMLRFSF